MVKLLFAIGQPAFEDAIASRMGNECEYIGTIGYKGGILNAVESKSPNVIIINETLQGNGSMLDILYSIKIGFPKTRIIFIAGDRVPGDEFLAALVGLGIYDVLYGHEIRLPDIVSLIRKANTYSDVSYLAPAPKIDESGKKIIFVAPDSSVKTEHFDDGDVADNHPSEQTAAPVVNTIPPEPQNVSDSDIAKKKESVFKFPLFGPKKQEDNSSEEQNKKINEKQKQIKLDLKALEHVNEIAKKNMQNAEKQRKEAEKQRKETEREKEKVELQKQEIQKREHLIAEKEKELKELQKQQEKIKPPSDNPVLSSNQIITFVGSKHGIGTTTLAFSSALMLAKLGYHTLYVEFDSLSPSTPIWYDYGKIDKGIDSAIISISKKRQDKISDAIITNEEFRHFESTKTTASYLSKNIDFFVFSKLYLSRDSREDVQEFLNMSYTKDLFLALVYQLGYDFVVLDVPPEINNEVMKNACMYSSKIFSIVSQDISAIGYGVNKTHAIAQRGIILKNKLYYIVNRFNPKIVSEKMMREYLESDSIVTIGDYYSMLCESNHEAIPSLFYKKNRTFSSDVNKIIKCIAPF